VAVWDVVLGAKGLEFISIAFKKTKKYKLHTMISKLTIITINYNNLNSLKRTVESVVIKPGESLDYS
jgi:hypothetical protein